jgi:hypothetical protein
MSDQPLLLWGIYREPEGIFPDGNYTLIETDEQNGKGGKYVDIWKLKLKDCKIVTNKIDINEDAINESVFTRFFIINPVIRRTTTEGRVRC